MQKIKYFKNHDYTAKATTRNGVTSYSIRFHGVEGSTEVEVDAEMFTLYMTEFKHSLEKVRTEKRRHIEDDANIGHLTAPRFEEGSLALCDIELVLKKCTKLQRKRFRRHFVEGLSFTAIARLEGCKEATVRQSVTTVREKILNFLT